MQNNSDTGNNLKEGAAPHPEYGSQVIYVPKLRNIGGGKFEVFTEVVKIWLSVYEFRTLSGLSKTSIYEAVRRGEISSVRVGKRILIPVYALDELLESQQSERG